MYLKKMTTIKMCIKKRYKSIERWVHWYETAADIISTLSDYISNYRHSFSKLVCFIVFIFPIECLNVCVTLIIRKKYNLIVQNEIYTL